MAAKTRASSKSGSKARAPAGAASKPPAKKPRKAGTARARSATKPAARARPSAKPATGTTRKKGATAAAKTGGGLGQSTTKGLSLTVDRLHQVALVATNLDESAAFYRDTLGLPFIARFDPPGLAFFNLGGGVRLMLSATASAATLYFHVSDINSVVRKLTRRGVSFLQKPALVHRDDQGHFGKKGTEEWMAFFRDPSQNLLALVERR